MISMSWSQFTDKCCFYNNNKVVKLKRKERDLLLLLILKQGVYVSYDELIKAFWLYETDLPDQPLVILNDLLDKLKEKIPGAINTNLPGYVTLPFTKKKRSVFPAYHPRG